jgi:serine/threonine-protein kinase
MGPVGFTRTVAIKRLHENFARDPEFVAMFLDEARLAARVRHPNVVPTLDIIASDGEVLLVMEYVSGVTLAELIKRSVGKETPIAVVADVMIGALRGLHAAHEATNDKGEPLQIVHRDISPQNIIVGTDGVARVLDFGVARAAGQIHATRAGQFKGKLRYASPEQLTGKGIDRRSDIYAAGLVLWEVLTGRPLITGTSDGEIMYSVLETRPAAPSSVRTGVPAVLDAVVKRALERDPERRFPTAEAMAMAIERAVLPVSRSYVTKWIHQLASDNIDKWKERVALVERDSDRSSPGPEVANMPSAPMAVSEGSHHRPVEVSRARSLRAQALSVRPRYWFAVLLVGFLAAGGATLIVVSRKAAEANRGAQVASPTVALPSVAQLPQTPASPSPAAVPQPPPAASSAAQSAVSSAEAAPSKPADSIGRRRSPSRNRPASAKAVVGDPLHRRD